MMTLQEMHQKILSSNKYDKMKRTFSHLSNFLGINKYYYFRILHNNYFSGLGSNSEWEEYIYSDLERIKTFPHFKHPNKLQSIVLFKNSSNTKFKEVLKTAWEKYNINFTVNVQRKIKDGIECFGFGINSDFSDADQHIINHLTLLNKYTDYFVDENSGLIHYLEDYQVDIASLIGAPYFKSTSNFSINSETKRHLLKRLGLEAIELLSPREVDIVKLISHGYPSTYIAEKLCLSNRTIEHYIGNIKFKLNCESKVSLINKANELVNFL